MAFGVITCAQGKVTLLPSTYIRAVHIVSVQHHLLFFITVWIISVALTVLKIGGVSIGSF